jgi:hypothetical protein
MRIFKTYTQFITEQVPPGGPAGINFGADPAATTTVVKTGKTDTKIDPSKPADQPKPATTAPDAAVMTKLLKIPNSRKSFMSNDNEIKPTVENGVSVDILGTGRSYNFRSAPQKLTVYIDDNSETIAYTGTYTMTDTEVITNSTDGKVTETIIMATARLAIDPTTKQPKGLPSNETADAKQKGVAQTVAAAIKANANYWASSNETVVHNATEAAIYWIVKNNLNPEQAKAFLAIAFDKGDAASTYDEMDAFTWGDFGYAPFFGGKPAGRVMDRISKWNADWASESDQDTKYLESKVPSQNSLVSYEPVGDDAKKWAETIWSIIDDSWVSADEEVNAIMAILVLTPKGLLNVDAAWKDLQTLGVIDSTLGIDAAIADEVDSPEAGAIVKLFAAALRGTPSEGAKKMLELS